MLRIKGMTKEEAPEEVRKVFEEQEKQHGSILNTAKVYGLRPTIQKGVQGLQAGILASGLISGELATSSLHESRQYQRLSVLN